MAIRNGSKCQARGIKQTWTSLLVHVCFGYQASRVLVPSKAAHEQEQHDRADESRDDGADNASTDRDA